MLSRCLQSSFRLGNCTKPLLVKKHLLVQHNLLPKRFSGHNAMNIEPSNYSWKYMKDMIHFYTIIAAVPIVVITTIINIRANPELTEIPEGYEPRHWEYYKHPITRFMAKYFYEPMELEHELQMALLENQAETTIMKKIELTVENVMKFYNDHRTRYFEPYYGEYFRIGRDEANYLRPLIRTLEGENLDQAYEPDSIIVPEGYKPEGYGSDN